jgi:hypothetical protein
VDIAIKTKRRYAGAMLASLLAVALFSIPTCASGQSGQGQGEPTRDNDTTRQELAGMDRFLDTHPEVGEQLRKDPSLIKNGAFVDAHPALAQYLHEHPGLRDEFSENPNAFMRQEERFDRHENDRDTTRQELAGLDRFLDTHPEIGEQLRKDPSLIKNGQFVDKHPALEQYLHEHPGLRDEFSENPNAFMRQEERFDTRQNDRDRDGRVGASNRDGRGELTSFGEFLGGHSTVAEQLSKDPSLANNKEYLSSHPELGEYLKAHPAMTQQLAQNPQGVMSSNWVQQANNTGTKAPMPKSKPNQ